MTIEDLERVMRLMATYRVTHVEIGDTKIARPPQYDTEPQPNVRKTVEDALKERIQNEILEDPDLYASVE